MEKGGAMKALLAGTKFLLIVLVMVTFAGCATSGLSSQEKFDEKSKQGIVFAAILYEGTYSANTIFVRSMDGRVRKTMRFGEAVLAWPVPPDGDYVDHGFASFSRKGGLIAEEFPPGNYEVYAWIVSGSGPSVKSAEPFSIRFTVEPGVATYIGAYQFKHQRTALMVSGASMSVDDEFERDEQVFRKKFINMQPLSVKNGIARYFRVMPASPDTPAANDDISRPEDSIH